MSALEGRRPRGDWMQTYTGRTVWPLDPDPEAIDIIDIAHALSHACRYAGHVTRFYSVAEHCVLVAGTVPGPDRLWAVLHDASEAYLVDVPRPIKPYLANYRDIEAGLMLAVCQRFGLPPRMPPTVAEADDRILWDERAQAMRPTDADWHLHPGGPLGVTLQFWPPERAKWEFMAAFTRASGWGPRA